jgi:hypothetical protein
MLEPIGIPVQTHLPGVPNGVTPMSHNALIEPHGDLVEVGSGREIGSVREAVGILVAAALPSTAWTTEVDLHVSGNRASSHLGHNGRRLTDDG